MEDFTLMLFNGLSFEVLRGSLTTPISDNGADQADRLVTEYHG